MFVLDVDKFSDSNPENIVEFVEFWSHFYAGGAIKIANEKKPIEYVTELNIGNDLTEENIIRLLRWKSPRHLTHIKLSGKNKGLPNPKIDKILSNRDKLNKFRNLRITPEEFENIVDEFFSYGIVYKAFIFHICRPLEYPIADQHVFRAYKFHCQKELLEDWSGYRKYIKYFKKLIQAYEPLVKRNQLGSRQKLDQALMVYGQFLSEYEERG